MLQNRIKLSEIGAQRVVKAATHRAESFTTEGSKMLSFYMYDAVYQFLHVYCTATPYMVLTDVTGENATINTLEDFFFEVGEETLDPKVAWEVLVDNVPQELIQDTAKFMTGKSADLVHAFVKEWLQQDTPQNPYMWNLDSDALAVFVVNLQKRMGKHATV